MLNILFQADVFLIQRRFKTWTNSSPQGTKLTFLARSHLAPKFSKVVVKAKKLGAIKKKKIVEKMQYTVMSNAWHICRHICQ